MKVDILNKAKEFEPIDVNLVIESQAELDSLIARLSVVTHRVNSVLDQFGTCKERAIRNSTSILLQKLKLLKG